MDFVRIGLFRNHPQYRLNFVEFPPKNSEGVMITHWARNPISAELKAKRCNVFYANNGRHPNLFFMRNKPIIADFEGYFVQQDMQNPEQKIDSPRVKKVICQTQWAYDDAIKLIKKKENREKMEVVKHAGRTDVKKNKLSDNEIRFLFLGENFFIKGGDWVVEAFKELYPKYPNIRLTIVSTFFSYFSFERNQSFEKPAAGALQNPAWNPETVEQQMNHPGITFIRRRISEQEKLDLYANADVFLFPSMWETFGCVLLEAMAHSLPVVSGNFGPLPEVLGGEQNAFFVDTKDADWYALACDTPMRKRGISQLKEHMERLIESKTLRKIMGRRVRVWMEREYSIEKRNNIMRRIYDDL